MVQKFIVTIGSFFILFFLNACGGGSSSSSTTTTEKDREVFNVLLDSNNSSYAPTYTLDKISSQLEYRDALGNPLDTYFDSLKIQDLIYGLDTDGKHVYMVTQRGKLIVDDNVTELFEKPLRSVTATGTKLAVLGYDGSISFVDTTTLKIDAYATNKNYQKIAKTRDSNIIYALTNEGTVDIIDVKSGMILYSFTSEVTFNALYVDFAIGENLAIFQSYTGEMAVYDISDLLKPEFMQSHPFNPSHFLITSNDDIYALNDSILMHIKYQYGALYEVSKINLDSDYFYVRDMKIDESTQTLYLLTLYDGKGQIYGYDISKEVITQVTKKYLDNEDSPGHFIFPYEGKVFGLWYGELREIVFTENDKDIVEGESLSQILTVGFKGTQSFDSKGFQVEYQYSKIRYLEKEQKLLVPVYGKTGSGIYLVDVKDGNFKVERFFIDENAYARMYSNVSMSQDTIFINSGYHVLMLDLNLNFQQRIPHLVTFNTTLLPDEQIGDLFWLDYYTPELTFVSSSNKVGDDIFLHKPTNTARCRIIDSKVYIYLPGVCGSEKCSEYNFLVPSNSYGYAILADENASKLYFAQTGRLSVFKDQFFQLDVEKMDFPYSSTLESPVFQEININSYDDYGYLELGKKNLYFISHETSPVDTSLKLASISILDKDILLGDTYPIDFSIDAVVEDGDKLYVAGSSFIGELGTDMNISLQQAESFESKVLGLQFDGYNYFYVATDSEVFMKRKTFYATWEEYVQLKKVYFDDTYAYRSSFKIEILVQEKDSGYVHFSRCDVSVDGRISNCDNELNISEYDLYKVYLFNDENANGVRDDEEEDFELHENTTIWEWN